MLTSVTVPSFLAYTAGIVVFFIGVHVNKRFSILRAYNIPEPVTGGLLAAMITFFLYLALDVEVTVELTTRDTLLVYFFTAIGLNARISDLISGGRPLLILLVLTLLYIVVQDAVGISGTKLLGLPLEVGILAGSASLIGGHGTAIAWAPDIAKQGVENDLEIGVASATLGLVIASLIGGPIARFLINRYQLKSTDTQSIVGISYANEETEKINHLGIMSVILTLHVAIIIGWFANQLITGWGLKLPLFVTCLLSAIVLSNTIPHVFPRMHWPARTRALAQGVRLFARTVFVNVVDEHAALDDRGTGRPVADHFDYSSSCGDRIHFVRVVSTDG